MSVRARQRRARQNGSPAKKVLAVLLAVVAVAGIGVGGAALWVMDVQADAPSVDSLRPANAGANTKVYDAEGKSLGYVQSEILRTPIDYEEIPESLQQATIAIEDENFWEHDGVDGSAIVRAAVENLEAGEIKQGASTITQQLVRNLYIEEPEDSLERKIIEATMAQEYEETHSKEKILEEYMNTATYGTTSGRSAIGVQAASEVFFNKPVEEIGLKEAALLAGLPQAPSQYNPFLDEQAALDRRNQVLNAMADQGYITQEKADEIKVQGPGTKRGYRFEEREQQFFFDYVQQELIERYGIRKVRQGGLRVYTTLDPDMQAAAETAIANHPTPLASNALVSTDVDTGEIIAMASSSDYGTSQFNLAAQGGRQPGSSFKPFVLTAAVDQGIDPDSTYYPAPSSITISPPDGSAPWPVVGGGSGSMSLRDATANSINTVYAQLAVDVGPDNFTDMAKRMGITSELDGYYAEALGGTTVCCSVLEMSNAYATLADGGVHHDPTAIRKVEFPNGDVDEPQDPEGDRVISDGVAYTVADVMEGTLDSGTAAGYDIACTASGKTGTTEEQVDAWFVGYTPYVSTAVWTGNADSRVALPGYGATLSAPIWNEYMDAWIAKFGDCGDYPEPEDPAELSSFSSSQTASSSYEETSTTTDPEATDDGTGDVPVAPGDDTDGDGYPDDAYAPGADQDPAPTPDG